MATRTKILGRLLVESGHVTEAQLEHALGAGRIHGERVGETLCRLGSTTEEQVASALAHQLGLPYASPPLEPEPEAVRAVRVELAEQYRLLPLRIAPRAIEVCMADPLDLRAVDDLQFQTGRRVRALVAAPGSVLEGIARAYGSGLVGLVQSLDDHTSPPRADALAAAERELERATRTTPVVQLVDRLLRRAVEEGASDIHVEETGADVRVRLRIDGVLRQALEIPAAARRAVLSRLKVIAGMDISVRRRAQDGRIPLSHAGRRLTLRVSTLPVNGGEKAVVRILDSDAAPRDLGALGMAPHDLGALRRLVARGEGVILAAGPTGSGKSTTLFAALSEVDRDTHNVVTLEDPVEYRLPGASQVQVDRRAGLDFADALRAVLRQDPDVVMIGEIRDRETAEIAMTAAVTGHLVLSTIHTTDAPGAITRLLNMGVPPFLVAGGLAGVVAQRLVRRSCPACRASGCPACTDGYRGRTGVYQVLTLNDALRDEVSRGGPTGRLRQLAREAGMRGLDGDARRAVASGLTTPHEIGRFLHVATGSTLPCPGCQDPVPMGSLGCPFCGAPISRRCSCGERLEHAWRFCPTCLRPAPPR